MEIPLTLQHRSNLIMNKFKDKRIKRKHTKEYSKRLKIPNFKEKRSKYARKWYLKNKKKISIKRKKKYNSKERKKYLLKCNSYTPEKHFEYKLRTRFNISLKEYNNILKRQKGVCAICKKQEKIKYSNGKVKTKRRMAIDHCHKTGKVRGLLCHFCNVGLGNFKDNKKLLLKAIKYLNTKK